MNPPRKENSLILTLTYDGISLILEQLSRGVVVQIISPTLVADENLASGKYKYLNS
jgi:hypothetical protein